MSIELIKDRLILDQRVGHETSQILLEGDFIVPDVKPDMKMILHTEGKISVEKMELSADKINYGGNLQINVLYLAKNAEKPVHSMVHNLPIDEFINIDGATREMIGNVKCDIIHLDCKFLNERKMSVKCVASVQSQVCTRKETEVLVSANDVRGTEFLKNSLKMSVPVENKQDKFVVKDELTIPSGKPNIREILQSKITLTNKEVKITDGKVSLKGELLICTLYVGDTDESIAEYIENEIPFNGGIEVRDAKEDMFADVILKIDDQYIQVKPDIDGEERVLDIEVTVRADLKLTSEFEMQAIEDAYCINRKTTLLKTKNNYLKTVCRNKNQSAIKESVQLAQTCPPIMQVYHVSGYPVIDDVQISDDRVIIEGAIVSDIIYVAESDDTPLFSYTTTIPFKQQLETKQARAGMTVDLDSEITHIGFNMLSPSEVEVRFVLNLNAIVQEENSIELINDLIVEDLDKVTLSAIPSMTIYAVQPLDTLWKIAKKYNTSVDDLVKLNDIEAPNKLSIGQKLLILKRNAE